MEMMKRLVAAAFTLGLVAAPGLAFAQSALTETATPGTYAPGSFDAPMHADHDKAAAIRGNEHATFGGNRSGAVDEYYGAQSQ
jgi:hypothetical protein